MVKVEDCVVQRERQTQAQRQRKTHEKMVKRKEETVVICEGGCLVERERQTQVES